MPSVASAIWHSLSNERSKCSIGDTQQPGRMKRMKQMKNCFQHRSPAVTLAANALDLALPAGAALLKNRKNCWVQLAGHPGSFAPAGPHTIWKKRLGKENSETLAYKLLMNDITKDVIPKFYREVEYNDNSYIEMEDLLQHFSDPFIMDIKMGTRTFLESEVSNSTLRKDLYEKMIKIDPSEPTAQENEDKAITKLRYMQFREKGSTTSTLGFRIQAMRVPGKPPVTDLQKVKTKEQVSDILAKFLDGNASVQAKLVKRCQEIRRKFEKSDFFKHQMEVIGSSLLLLFDRSNEANVWMIDFAKTRLLDKSTPVTHRAPWAIGNHEDGYLTGLDNLIQMLSKPELTKKTTQDAQVAVPVITPHKQTTLESPHTKTTVTHHKSTPTLEAPHVKAAVTLHKSTTLEVSHEKPTLTAVHTNGVLCTVQDSRHNNISVT
ncbi:hypothetical protein NP493_186g01049 [Ridgeia piscesae]|uniref:Kinase n=1 Tax=Ridgeia piscesae TaxID=27915 RepID=A0AAD9P2Q3_RIDPI|nr:hypothetical protein NP493_186g01049 [Ridgeia piscesae]